MTPQAQRGAYLFHLALAHQLTILLPPRASQYSCSCCVDEYCRRAKPFRFDSTRRDWLIFPYGRFRDFSEPAIQHENEKICSFLIFKIRRFSRRLKLEGSSSKDDFLIKLGAVNISSINRMNQIGLDNHNTFGKPWQLSCPKKKSCYTVVMGLILL